MCALNYAVVAQILDIFLPSANTIELPGVGAVGEAAVFAAPIIICLEMVAGIALHRAWDARQQGRGSFTAVAATFGFAFVLVLLQTVGAYVRGVIVGGFTGFSGRLDQIGPGLSALIGFGVCVADMYTGAASWSLFLANALDSTYYRVQAIGLWLAAGWLHIVAGRWCHLIHSGIVTLARNIKELARTGAAAVEQHKRIRDAQTHLEQRHQQLASSSAQQGIAEIGAEVEDNLVRSAGLGPRQVLEQKYTLSPTYRLPEALTHHWRLSYFPSACLCSGRTSPSTPRVPRISHRPCASDPPGA